MITLDTILEQAEGLLQSRALPYVLAAVAVLVWWVVSAVVGLLRRGRVEMVDRPTRRLPLQ